MAASRPSKPYSSAASTPGSNPQRSRAPTRQVLVLRNAGGRATDAVLADLAFLSFMFEQNQPDGQPFEVAVLHHTGCGSAALANPTIRQRFAERSGLHDATLAGQAIIDPTDRVR